jgi:hypothetical protein
MRAFFASLVAVLALVGTSTAQTGVTIDGELDVRALRIVNMYFEACIMGSIEREGRIQMLNSHPLLQKLPVPPDSEAARRGRLMWRSKDGVFIVLEPDMHCRAVVTDETIKMRLAKFIENTNLGQSGAIDPIAFAAFPITDAEREAHRSRNIDVKAYLWQKPNIDIGVLLTLETSIETSPNTYPARISARYVREKRGAQ